MQKGVGLGKLRASKKGSTQGLSGDQRTCKGRHISCTFQFVSIDYVNLFLSREKKTSTPAILCPLTGGNATVVHNEVTKNSAIQNDGVPFKGPKVPLHIGLQSGVQFVLVDF